MTSEVRVGILFFLGLGLAVWFTFFVTSIGRPKGDLFVRFPKVLQLKDGDAVTYNGVRVGTVAKVEPDVVADKAVVKVIFSVDDEVRSRVLLNGAPRFSIGSGLLGGAYLEIISDGGEPISQARLDGIMGETPAAVADAVNSLYRLIEENRESVNETMIALKDAVVQFKGAMEQVQGVVKDNREQVGKTVASIGEMSANINKLVVDNREQIKHLLVHFDAASKQVAELVAENRTDLREAFDQLPALVASITDAAKRIEAMVADNSGDVRTTMQQLAAFAPKLDRIGANLELITKQISEGKGTVGKLVFEDTLHTKAVQATESLNDRLEEVKPFTSGLSDLKLYAGLDGGWNTDTSYGTAIAYLRLEPRPWKYYQGGVSYRSAPADRETANEDPDKLHVDFNIELGWRFIPDNDRQFYWLTVAGGLIESKIGARVFVPLGTDRLRLHMMARQKDDDREPDDRRFEEGEGDVLARATIEWQPFARWRISIVGGADDLVDNPSPWFGLRGELLDNDLRNLTTITGLAP
ncbi:MAG TPA: MlaD family protein [Planctomycetota bacterium]|nr:MlaD family protein [Planctomycetota bacterium]